MYVIVIVMMMINYAYVLCMWMPVQVLIITHCQVVFRSCKHVSLTLCLYVKLTGDLYSGFVSLCACLCLTTLATCTRVL